MTIGLKLSAREMASAANPCWTWETQVGVEEKDCGIIGWFLRVQEMGFVNESEVDLGCGRDGWRRVIGGVVLGLNCGRKE